MSLLKIHLIKKMYAACNSFAYILILLKYLIISKKEKHIFKLIYEMRLSRLRVNLTIIRLISGSTNALYIKTHYNYKDKKSNIKQHNPTNIKKKIKGHKDCLQQ